MKFSEYLLEKRLEANLTTSEAAKRAGMTVPMWSRWESGMWRGKEAPSPRRKTIHAFAIALNLSDDEILLALNESPPGRESLIKKEIGDRIRYRRERLGLSQMTIAKQLSVSRELISSWENGKTEIGAIMLGRLSKILQVTPNYFYEDNDHIAEVQSDAQAMIQKLSKTLESLARKLDGSDDH
jgi:transcriptional regulator with XRE-family HTH domain